MLINLVLSLFAIYLLVGLVVLFGGLFFLVSMAYYIQKEDKLRRENHNKKEKI